MLFLDQNPKQAEQGHTIFSLVTVNAFCELTN